MIGEVDTVPLRTIFRGCSELTRCTFGDLQSQFPRTTFKECHSLTSMDWSEFDFTNLDRQ